MATASEGKPTILRYRVDARVVRSGVSRAEAKAAAIEFDSSAGQRDDLLGPAELLAAAFGACMLKNVERFSSILPFAYTGASISVTAEREETPPRIARMQYVLRVTTDEPAHRLDLLHRNLQKHGTVYNTLAAACAVSGEILVE
jgi:uncharacterized OsmC-like protein